MKYNKIKFFPRDLILTFFFLPHNFPVSHANEEAIDTEPVTNDNFFATPGLVIQQVGKNGKCKNQVTSQLYSF